MADDKPKDYRSTIMRMAGNIAAGLVAQTYVKDEAVATRAVAIAKQIVALVTETDAEGQE